MKLKNRLNGSDNERRQKHRKKNKNQSITTEPSENVKGLEEECIPGIETEADDFLPPFSIWLVHLASIIVRIAIVSDKTSWWILHPDEVFQTVEGRSDIVLYIGYIGALEILKT